MQEIAALRSLGGSQLVGARSGNRTAETGVFLFRGEGIPHGERGFVFESGGCIGEIDAVFPQIRVGLGRIPLEAHCFYYMHKSTYLTVRGRGRFGARAPGKRSPARSDHFDACRRFAGRNVASSPARLWMPHSACDWARPPCL